MRRVVSLVLCCTALSGHSLSDAEGSSRAKITGYYKLDEWNDRGNRIEQTLQLTPGGIVQASLSPAKVSAFEETPLAGAPVNSGRTENLALHWPFDEGKGQTTKEQVTGEANPVKGVDAHWRRGVSGTCLSFDSYSNAVVLPASECQPVKGMVTISAWIVPQEYPFNLAAIVDHLKGNRGYFLGMNAKGQIVFRAGKGDSVQEPATTSPLPLFEWTHVAAVYGQAMVIYLDGEPVTAMEPALGRLSDAPAHELSIGMTRSFAQHPFLGERNCTRQFKTNMVFSGLIDEVKIFNRHLFHRDVKAEYDQCKPSDKTPLQPWVLPAGPEQSSGFGAAYAKLEYRNSSVSIHYKWPAVDEDGRGIWTDEYWTIYPDGISIRHQLVHNNTGKGITGELNQNEILHQPGQTTGDLLHDAAVIIASTDGETETIT